MIGNKESDLVPDNRAAEGQAKLILLQDGTRTVHLVNKEVIPIQRGVAEKFEAASVKLVGPAAGDDVHVCAAIMPVGSIVGDGLNVEFLDGVWIGNRIAAAEGAAALQVINLNTIHFKIVIGYGTAGSRER